MKTARKSGFTLIELLLVVAIIAILTSMLMPTVAKTQARAKRVQCLGNLKEDGFAFHVYANDHENLFPMQVHVHDGGTLEWTTMPQSLSTFAYKHFQSLSNQVTNPKILVCPTDTGVTVATNWVDVQNTNLSYFVWVTARPNMSSDPLAGDRNIGWNTMMSPSDRYNVDNYFWQTNMHVACGNVVFADGRVELLNTDGLRRAIQLGLQQQ